MNRSLYFSRLLIFDFKLEIFRRTLEIIEEQKVVDAEKEREKKRKLGVHLIPPASEEGFGTILDIEAARVRLQSDKTNSTYRSGVSQDFRAFILMA